MGTKLKSAPVFYTIGQVQHNPLLNLGSYLAEIQERMRKAGYPDFKRGVQMQFAVSPGMVVDGSTQAPQPAVHKVERFMFSDVSGTKGFVLQTNSLSFETTEYDTFKSFLGDLKVGLGILSEAVGGLSFMERLGLRYVDAVAPAPGETLQQYLENELLGLPHRLPDSMFLYSFSEALLFAEGVGQVVSRTVSQNGKLGFPPDLQPVSLKVSSRFEAISGEHAVIDTDGSFTERRPFDAADIETRLLAVHDLIEKSFHATVTDYARKAWAL